MEDTEQFNIRLPKALLYDLEFVSQHVKINRNDWVRLNLAKIIMDTKGEIIGRFEKKYVDGFLTDEEFKKLAGFNPTEGMKEVRAKELGYKEKGKEEFRKYAQELARIFKDESKKIYFDGYLKKIIKKVDSEKKEKNVNK